MANEYKDLLKELTISDKNTTYELLVKSSENLLKGRTNKSILKMMNAYKNKQKVSLIFNINENGIKNISLDNVLTYNHFGHDYFVLIRKLRALFPSHEFDILDEYCLIRTTYKTRKNDYDLYYHSYLYDIDKYISINSGFVELPFNNNSSEDLLKYLKSFKYRYLYIKDKSIFDIDNDALQYALFVLIFALANKHGFTPKVIIYKKR